MQRRDIWKGLLAAPMLLEAAASGPNLGTGSQAASSGNLVDDKALRGGSIQRAGGVFNVRDFGAAGDGKTLDTAAINRAIDACTSAGGGQVRLPPGTYLSGTVLLKSNVALRVDAGARLLGTADLTQYHNYNPPAGSFEAKNPRWQRALVLITGAVNVGISGEGVIDGSKVHDPTGEEGMRGPHTILAGSSQKLTIRDVTIVDSANYAMLLEWTDDIDIHNVKVTGGWDGAHLRWCRNVVISGCKFYTGDDSIAGRYWENVLVANCIINSSCNGIRVIGPAKRLVIQNCLIYGPGLHPHRTQSRFNLLAGIYLQPGSWDPSEGDLDDVLISDVTMRNPAAPFRLIMHKNNRGGEIVFNRISATGVYGGGVSLVSDDAPVQRVVLRDISIEWGKSDPTSKGEYKTISAWGLTARNLNALRLENVRLTSVEPQTRPVMVLDDVHNVSVDGLRTSPSTGEGSSIVINNVDEQEFRDIGSQMLAPRCTELSIASHAGGPKSSGKAISVTATVVNMAQAGMGKVELEVEGRKLVHWIWLNPNDTRKVTFENLKSPTSGKFEIRCGAITKMVGE